MRKVIYLCWALAFAIAAGAQVKVPIRGVAPVTMDSVVVFDLTRGVLRAKIPVKDGRFATQLSFNEQELLGVGSREFYIPVFADPVITGTLRAYGSKPCAHIRRRLLPDIAVRGNTINAVCPLTRMVGGQFRVGN